MLTSLAEHAPVHAQVLPSTVLLEHSDLIPHAVQVGGETHRFAKVHHVYGHSALVHRAPHQWGVLDGKKEWMESG